MNREKVIKGLEDSFANQGCGYMDGVGELYAISGEDLQNALALLKEQEAVEPTLRHGGDGIFVWACGSCGAYMYHINAGSDKAKEYAKYCRQCGRKVKWE